MFGRKKKKSSSKTTVQSALSQLNQSGVSSPNAKAYKWLDKALFTSSKVTKEEKESGVVEYDNIFPTTADQTEMMYQCIEEAQDVAADKNDAFLNERIEMLKNIVNWSYQRHNTVQWILIVGVAVTLLIFNLMRGSQEDNVARVKGELEVVKVWVKQDTTIAYADVTKIDYAKRLKSANNYKRYKLDRLKVEAESSAERAVQLRQYADTASTKDSKKQYLKGAKESEKNAEERREEYAEINDMKFKEFYKLAMSDMKRAVKREQSESRSLLYWVLFFVILIPLYIVSQRPYGYTMTRLKTESAVVGGIQKIFIGMASGLTLGGLAMQYVPTTYVTKWSDGSTTRESGSTAEFFTHLTIKGMIIGLGVLIFCFTSSVLMIYLTVQGLRRNYNWNNIMAKAQNYTQK